MHCCDVHVHVGYCGPDFWHGCVEIRPLSVSFSQGSDQVSYDVDVTQGIAVSTIIKTATNVK